MTSALISRLISTTDVEQVMADVKEISSFDRYQASLGLEAAAASVAASAEAAGLRDVGVQRFPADGEPQWWTFRSPVAWTPLTARLTVSAGPHGSAEVLHVDHARRPFAVATYSAPTPAAGLTAPLVRVRGDGPPPAAGLRGAVAVVDAAAMARGALTGELAAAGALGFVTDAPWKGDAAAPHRGRIELAPHSPLFAFSLTPPEFAAAAAAAERGGTARAEVHVDRGSAMPVVSGVLPGDEDVEEIWLTAHLCHPRPGSNDNASGVAALLGAARTLARLRKADAAYGTRRPVRFFWGPEFTGTAAVLHGHTDGRGRLPAALINLDMVGEDQALCRSPFVVERPAETTPSLLAPVAEHVVAEVFRATAAHPGTWHPSPFLGFSDHALYADPSVDRPAVQFCHPEDRFNHAAGDTPDKVSPVEMLRSTTAGAALAQLLASDAPGRRELERLVDHWCVREEAAAAAHPDAGSPWGQGLRAHVRTRGEALRDLAARGEGGTARGGPTGPAAAPARRPEPAGPALTRRWDGPLNLRAMAERLPHGSRARLASAVARDKQQLSVLFNLAIRADGRRDRDGLVAETSYGLRRQLDGEATGELLDALVESGWLSEGDGDGDGDSSDSSDSKH
ncbi:DUF4910 domain-containing protein [Streptomyces sp. NPDC096339]|uniref:DUF4910 domain-containing protein n=1 Tax=Streptomyces sp. NPDC096339 TaxID=3366086 RepID=UPI0037F5F10F